jgi:AmmeMemoRadiSam system protein A
MSTHIDQGLKKESQIELLRIARETLKLCTEGKACDKIVSNLPELQAHLGAFVTLTKSGELRGCIGNFEPEQPLWQVVREMAIAASLEDPRFSPVRPEEVGHIRIEISVLTPRQKIQDIDEIQVGTHGLYIKRGWHAGTLLPQVAVEYKWDKATFLKQTCYKAGLPADAWMDPQTEIFVYSAIIIHE